MQNDEHPPSLRHVESEKLNNMFIDTIEFNFCKPSQVADDYAWLYNRLTLCTSSTDVLMGITAFQETLLLLTVITTHRKTATIKARERAADR